MIVFIRHKPGQSKVYMFNVPAVLEPFIHLGAHVLCDTRRGIQPGEVIEISYERENPVLKSIVDVVHMPSISEDIHVEDML